MWYNCKINFIKLNIKQYGVIIFNISNDIIISYTIKITLKKKLNTYNKTIKKQSTSDYNNMNIQKAVV